MFFSENRFALFGNMLQTQVERRTLTLGGVGRIVVPTAPRYCGKRLFSL
jgi:hypothetical protein